MSPSQDVHSNTIFVCEDNYGQSRKLRHDRTEYFAVVRLVAWPLNEREAGVDPDLKVYLMLTILFSC